MMTRAAVTKRSRPSVPLAPVAMAVVVGVLLDRFALAWPTRTWIAIAVVLAVVGFRVRPRWGLSLVLAAVVALGAAWHHRRWSDLAPDDLARGDWSQGGLVQLRGGLIEVPTFRPGSLPHDSGLTRSRLLVTGSHDGTTWHRVSGRVDLLIPGDRTDLAMGEEVSAAGTLRTIDGPLNPGEVDFRDVLRGDGVRLRLVVASPRSVWVEAEEGGWPWHRMLGWARASSQRVLVAGLAPDAAALGSALLLGRREAVDPADNDAFARTGTTHLLAISGLHLQVLAGLTWGLARSLGLRRTWTVLSVMVLVLGYGALVGWVPSVARSTAMTMGACAAGLLDRTARVSHLLAAAALATLALDPSNLFDVGCQLSFLGVAALCWGGPAAIASLPDWLAQPLHPLGSLGPPVAARLGNLDAVSRRYEPRWLKVLRWCASWLTLSFLMSLVAWVVTLPLVVHVFHVVPGIGLLLNVPLVPLTSVALVASLLTLAASTLWAPLGTPFAFVGSICLNYTQSAVRWGADLSWGHVFDPGPPLWWVLGFYALAALMARLGSRHRGVRVGAVGWLAAGAITYVLPSRPASLEADVLAVGHGLAVVAQGTDGRVLLYDCGKLGDPKVGRRVIAPALWSRGARRIDTVILSHADSDHFNGLDDLLERFQIGVVRVPPDFGGPSNPLATTLLRRLRDANVDVRPIVAGDEVDLGDARAVVVHPPADWRPDVPDNARCVVLEVQSGPARVLLTGDLEGPGLMSVASGPARAYDVALAPHHGGRTANPPWLYSWANPAVVAVSQARPATGTADFLSDVVPRAARMFRTWRDGTIRLRWGPEGVDVRGFLHPVATIAPVWPMRLAIVLGGVVLGLGLAVLLGVLVFGPWFLVAPGRVVQPPEKGPPKWRPLTISARDGIALRAAWRPAGEGRPPRGTAILLHGIGECGSALCDRGNFLAELGFDVLRPDSRGTGASGGTVLSYGGREAADVRAWVDALPRREGPLALWGRSMGAAIAARVAAEDARVEALILEVPYADLTSAVALGLRRKGLPGTLAPWLLRRAETIAGVPIARPSPVDLAGTIRVPVMVLQGGDDPVAPPAEIERLVAAFPNQPSRENVPGAQHADVFERGGPALRAAIASFLDTV